MSVPCGDVFQRRGHGGPLRTLFALNNCVTKEKSSLSTHTHRRRVLSRRTLSELRASNWPIESDHPRVSRAEEEFSSRAKGAEFELEVCLLVK
jgi:hypothetical protein